MPHANTARLRQTSSADACWLQAALEIGRELARTAQRDGRQVRWLGDDLDGDQPSNARLVRREVGDGLYSGRAGIGWFLAQLGAYSGETQLSRTGLAALSGAVAAPGASLNPRDLSLYTGAAGAALAALQVAQRERLPALRKRAIFLTERVAASILRHEEQPASDLIDGLAGVVVALAAAHRLAPAPIFVAACDRACEQLLQRRQPAVVGSCWLDPHGQAEAGHAAPGLCGLAHGASGIAWALHEGARLTGRQAYAVARDEALTYERGWFDAQSCNWPDLRGTSASEPRPPLMTAWCHGALGIGALRWHLYEETRDPSLLAEASACIQAARALTVAARRQLGQGQLTDATLCHGLGGAVELLLFAYEVTGLEEHLRAARSTGQLCLDIQRTNQGRWTVGVPGGSDVPGLMVGLAGIGAMMLRLHEPSALASPLLPGRLAPARLT